MRFFSLSLELLVDVIRALDIFNLQMKLLDLPIPLLDSLLILANGILSATDRLILVLKHAIEVLVLFLKQILELLILHLVLFETLSSSFQVLAKFLSALVIGS